MVWVFLGANAPMLRFCSVKPIPMAAEGHRLLIYVGPGAHEMFYYQTLLTTLEWRLIDGQSSTPRAGLEAFKAFRSGCELIWRWTTYRLFHSTIPPSNWWYKKCVGTEGRFKQKLPGNRPAEAHQASMPRCAYDLIMASLMKPTKPGLESENAAGKCCICGYII